MTLSAFLLIAAILVTVPGAFAASRVKPDGPYELAPLFAWVVWLMGSAFMWAVCLLVWAFM